MSLILSCEGRPPLRGHLPLLCQIPRRARLQDVQIQNDVLSVTIIFCVSLSAVPWCSPLYWPEELAGGRTCP